MISRASFKRVVVVIIIYRTNDALVIASSITDVEPISLHVLLPDREISSW